MSLSPDEAVVPVIVAVVLECVVGGLGLGGVVGATAVAGGLAGEGRVGGQDGCSPAEEELDVALEVDGEADVGCRRERRRCRRRPLRLLRWRC